MASNKKWHRAVTSFACFGVATDEKGIIIESAPIGKKFLNQPIDNLKRWVEKSGGTVEELPGNGQ